ncbi:epoxide hydrolase, soluble (sEH) [Cryptotrichosporon argae]
MLQTNLLAPGHADLVTDVTYDFYGELLATCSADQRIKLFRKSSDGSYLPEAEWKAHDAPVLRLSFSHPIHGSLLASSSHDRTVRIWEEPTASAQSSGRWIERAVLSGAKGSVRGVEFSPPNPAFGLRIAHQPHDDPATAGWGVSWCRERWWGSVLAAFAGNSPVVKIISLDPTPNSLLHLAPTSTSPLTSLAWAPSCGRSYHLLATGARDGSVRIWRLEPPNADEGRDGWRGETEAEFAKGARVGMVAWNATGTTLTTSDDEGVIRIYKATYAKTWKLLGKMSAEEPPNEGGA